MNNRRNTGSITAFSAACLIILVIVGVFAYKFTALVGGGEQLQHACDAGTLSLAREALVSPQVFLNDPTLPRTNPSSGALLPYEDFFACIGETEPDSINPSGIKPVTLLNINKILAQALLVADSAQTEGTASAIGTSGHGEDVLMAAHNLADYLRSKLTGATPI